MKNKAKVTPKISSKSRSLFHLLHGGMTAPERLIPLIIVLVTTMLFMVRLSGPPNLIDNDQERPASYILDVVKNGHWIYQTDELGDIASKPPLYTWLSAISTYLMGQGKISLLTLYLPCYLSIVGIGLLLYFCGRRSFGVYAAGLGAMVFIISPIAMKQVALARTDALFTFTVTISAFIGYWCWQRGKGWIWFWIGVSLAGLTKGPLGLLLASGGFFSFIWNKKSKAAPLNQRSISPKVLLGICVFFAIVGGWFLLAFFEGGDALYEKIIRAELMDHAVSKTYGIPGAGFILTPFYLVTRFLPWSLIGIWAIIDVFRHPAQEENARRLERFLVCWILFGCFVMALGTHQRGDLIFPMVPPLALLTGRVLEKGWPVTLKENPMIFLKGISVLAAVGITIILCYNRFVFSKQEVTYRTKALERASQNILNAGIDLKSLKYFQVPFTLQFYLNTMTYATKEEDVRAFFESDLPSCLAVSDLENLKKALGPKSPPYRVMFCWYLDNKPFLYILNNSAWSKEAESLNSSSWYFNSKTIYDEPQVR